MFLQATNNPMNSLPLEKKIIPLWEILFSGGILGNTIMGAIFLLGIMALYVFFERYFFIKRASREIPDFVATIKDCIHDGRIEAAVDLCRRTNSPEARMIEKGLQRIGRPISDISNAIQNQGQMEVSILEKNLNLLASASGTAPMLGFLGTVIGMMLAFLKMSEVSGSVSPKLLTEGIYTALSTTVAGLFVGIPAYFLYNLLVTKIDRFILKVQTQANEFLDVLNKPL